MNPEALREGTIVFVSSGCFWSPLAVIPHQESKESQGSPETQPFLLRAKELREKFFEES